MPAGAILPVYRWVVLDASGNPAPGAKATFTLSGTSTPHPVYEDADLMTAYTQPVTADMNGVLPIIYLDAVNYRVLITESDGTTIYPAQDNIYDFAQIQNVTIGPKQFTYIYFTANGYSNVPGSIANSSVNGLVLQARTGGTYDFTFWNPAGGTRILQVPTGTTNIELTTGSLTLTAGKLTVDSGTATGSMPTVGQFNVKSIHLMTGTTDGYTSFFGLTSPNPSASPVVSGDYLVLTHASGTTTTAIGRTITAETNAVGTTTTMRAHDASVAISSSGGGTDAVCYNAQLTGRIGAGAGTFTNAYGLKVGTKGAGITNGYSVFCDDATVVLRNDGPVQAGRAFTGTGSVSATTAVATTLFNTSGVAGLWIVDVLIANTSSIYTASANVTCDGTNCRIQSNDGGSMALTLSGTAVQATQTSGGTETISYSYLRIR